MTQPKTKDSKQILPELQHAAEPILIAAVLAKLTLNSDRPARIGSSEVSKVLQSLRKHPAAVRREKSHELISFDVKISPERRLTVILRSEGLDALSHFNGNLGILAPMIMKACERGNNSHFEKDVKGLLGQIKVGQLQPGKPIKLSVKGNVISLC